MMVPALLVPDTLVLPETVLRFRSLENQQALDLVSQSFAAVPVTPARLKRLADGEKITIYAVLCKGLSVSEDEDEDETILKAYASKRVRVLEYDSENNMLAVEEDPEIQDLDDIRSCEMTEYIQNIVDEIAETFRGGQIFARQFRQYSSLSDMIVYLSRYMPLSEQERNELLGASSIRERAVRFMDFLLRQKEIVSLHVEMNEKLSKESNEYYRKMALRRQLESIQQELNEEDGKQESESYSARIEASDIPAENKKSLLEDAARLENGSGQGSDAEVLRTYLDFALSLPWKKEEALPIDLKEARAILDERHYGMEKVKERIIQHLAVMKLRSTSRGSALLLVGPPGTGKTSLGKSIARALQRPYVRMSLGGIRDESEIRGHRRTYVGAMAGRILKSMKQAGQTNPVLVLDEMEKMMQGGFSGDPAAAMLEVLDPEQNDTFTDHYLDLPYDLSDVFFIGTANSLDGIPAPLLDRMEVIQVPSYTGSEKFEIARQYLVPEVLLDHGMTPDQLQFTDDALHGIVDDYTMEAGCRGLKKRLAQAARIKAVNLAEDNSLQLVDRSDLEDLFGAPLSHRQKVRESNPYGVVTGLAWTAVGGEVLYIEAASMPGSGQMMLTGQLGDVMKESARISLSVLKSRLPLNAMIFKEQDIHIHFPAGATPKDGPSAGITIFTALASLALQKPVDSHIAMTGELSLSGSVLPIGGLREKLYGAMRAGIRKVLIPWDNRADLRDVPAEVLDSLEIIPVRTAEEVLQETLQIALPPLHTEVLADTSRIFN